MPRVKAGNKRLKRRQKLAKITSGNYLGRRNLFRTMAETAKRAMYYSYRDRKAKKRNYRRLWQARISAALGLTDMSYSRFIFGLKQAGVELNRKMLSEIAIAAPEVFTALVDLARANAVKAA